MVVWLCGGVTVRSWKVEITCFWSRQPPKLFPLLQELDQIWQQQWGEQKWLAGLIPWNQRWRTNLHCTEQELDEWPAMVASFWWVKYQNTGPPPPAKGLWQVDTLQVAGKNENYLAALHYVSTSNSPFTSGVKGKFCGCFIHHRLATMADHPFNSCLVQWFWLLGN